MIARLIASPNPIPDGFVAELWMGLDVAAVLPLALGRLGAAASILAELEPIADYRAPPLIASAVLGGVAWCGYFGRHGAIRTVVASIRCDYISLEEQQRGIISNAHLSRSLG
jgi:hypothetical protein